MEGVRIAAELMAVAAKTAPKAKGNDFLEIEVIYGEDLNRLADAMAKFADENDNPGFKRDGENVRNSDALLLVSVNDAKVAGLNCGACGKDTCAQLIPEMKEGPQFAGPICAWRLMDLGIAIGSAAKMAGIFNVDNRVMYRPAVQARQLGMIKGEMVAAIPMVAAGKSIYFDR